MVTSLIDNAVNHGAPPVGVRPGGELRLRHHDVHVSHGRAVDLTCPEHAAMCATVILPSAP